MGAAFRAGLVYFAIVFATGFSLGTLRVIVLEPRLGESAAVMLELPLMLSASWFACRWLLGVFRLPRRLALRATMGGVGFVLLMAAEFGLGGLVGRGPALLIAGWGELPGALGLAAQIAFALFPVLQAGPGSRC